MWKNTAQPDRPQMKNMAHAHCMLDKHGYRQTDKHTHMLCNTQRFSITTMVTRTRFDVTLYEHCPSYTLLHFPFAGLPEKPQPLMWLSATNTGAMGWISHTGIPPLSTTPKPPCHHAQTSFGAHSGWYPTDHNRYNDSLRAWSSGVRNPVGVRDFPHLSTPALVPTYPPVRYRLLFLVRYSDRGVAITTLSNLESRLKKE